MTEPTQLSEAEIDQILLRQHEEVSAEYGAGRPITALTGPLGEVMERIVEKASQPSPPRVYRCEKCGVVVEASRWCEPCQREAAEELRQERGERAIRFAESLPLRYVRATVEHPKILTWLEMIGESDDSLLLTGGVGRGKTWQMFGAAIKGIKDGRFDSVAWASVPELLRDLRPGGIRSEPGGMRDLYDADVLLLDDLGAHKPTEWAEAELGILLDRRWRDTGLCIITTNLPPGKLGEALGDRIASRLAGSCTVVALSGPDRRKP